MQLLDTSEHTAESEIWSPAKGRLVFQAEAEGEGDGIFSILEIYGRATPDASWIWIGGATLREPTVFRLDWMPEIKAALRTTDRKARHVRLWAAAA